VEFAGKVSYAVEEGTGPSRSRMKKTTKFTYWQDGDYYLGFLNDYPDYQTQGMSKEELVDNLRDLLADLESGEIPYIRKTEELVVAD
jgi:predicted RNase H-like HicB family nuclease